LNVMNNVALYFTGIGTNDIEPDMHESSPYDEVRGMIVWQNLHYWEG